MATSPLFGWEEPDDVDLVKDGAAAIRTLGNAIDTSMGDLLGGTTGQVLSKASNTNMDFTWVAQDDSNAIQNAIVDAKGDLIAATGADTPARLAVGSDYAFLQAMSSESAGLKYGNTWTSYTPTWTNITVGNGTNTGEYLRIGKMVIVKVSLTFGSTTSFTGSYVQVSLPFNADTFYANNGGVIMFDVGSGVYNGFSWNTDATKMNIQAINTNNLYALSADIGSTIPFTWTTNDILTAQFIYEAA
jgi:hypothetical protein